MFMNCKSARLDMRRLATALCAVAALVFGAGSAHAGVPGADFYVGAGIGQSNADMSASDLSVSSFDKKDMGWKVFAGGRFVSLLGAELDYINFGKPNGSNAEVKYKALAGYGLFYFPIPLPVLDVYAKAGLARVDSDLRVNASSFSSKGTKFAYGAGLQLKFGSFAVRGEYERFKTDGAKPSLLSVSLSKSFL